MCTDVERSLFSPRASQGQIVAHTMGRLEGRHCCSGACVQPKSALRTRSVPRARLSLRRTACSVSQCCAYLTQRVTVFGDHEAISTVWPLVSYLTRWSPFTGICFADCCVHSARSRTRALPLDLLLDQRTGSLLSI